MLLKVLQLGIFVFTTWGLLEYNWTPNGTLAGGLGFCAAYALTVFPTKFWYWLRTPNAIRPLPRNVPQEQHEALPQGHLEQLFSPQDPVFRARPKQLSSRAPPLKGQGHETQI